MKATKICSACGAKHYITIEEEITFTSEGQILKATATRFNDAFYEITKGIYTGNLVHIFDIIK
jgi:isocitrate dehydrogenase